MGQMIEFKRPDGGSTKGYYAQAGQGRPSVIVIQLLSATAVQAQSAAAVTVIAPLPPL